MTVRVLQRLDEALERLLVGLVHGLAVEDWFEEGYASPDLVDVRSGTHGDRAGTILEPDSQAMDEADKETFKSLIKTLEDSDCHAGFLDDGCSQCGEDDGEYWWFVPEDDSSEGWT